MLFIIMPYLEVCKLFKPTEKMIKKKSFYMWRINWQRLGSNFLPKAFKKYTNQDLTIYLIHSQATFEQGGHST